MKVPKIHDIWKKISRNFRVMNDTKFVIFSFVYYHIYTLDSYWCIMLFLNSPLRLNG